MTPHKVVQYTYGTCMYIRDSNRNAIYIKFEGSVRYNICSKYSGIFQDFTNEYVQSHNLLFLIKYPAFNATCCFDLFLFDLMFGSIEIRMIICQRYSHTVYQTKCQLPSFLFTHTLDPTNSHLKFICPLSVFIYLLKGYYIIDRD